MRVNKDKELVKILKIVAPGTELREGLENILRAKTGGLILIGDGEEELKLIDGGFNIDAQYSPAYVYELAKMDGAIVLSSNLNRIRWANTQLMPDQSIATQETGTRHRTANRVAVQTKCMVVAISQRRNIISIYKGDLKYVLKDGSKILAKANQAIQTLEKYVSVQQNLINKLNVLEFQDMVTLFDIMTAIQRSEMVMRIVEEIQRYIYELGNEGRLISMQLNELIEDLEEEEEFLIRDYCQGELEYEKAYEKLQMIDYDDLIDLDRVAKILGYGNVPLVDTIISPRGYRMLAKIPRIPSNVVENLVDKFYELKSIVEASFEELESVEGIGEARAKTIKTRLRRLREEFILDRSV